jgi:hypothetical protein
VPLQIGDLPAEHQAVHAGQKPEGVPLVHPVVLVTGQRRSHRPAGLGVGPHPFEQHRVEAPPGPARHLHVAVELSDQRIRHDRL